MYELTYVNSKLTKINKEFTCFFLYNINNNKQDNSGISGINKNKINSLKFNQKIHTTNLKT